MFFLFSFLQPVMLIVPDVEDVYTPLQTDLIVPLGEVWIYINSFSSQCALCYTWRHTQHFHVNLKTYLNLFSICIYFLGLVSRGLGAVVRKYSKHVPNQQNCRVCFWGCYEGTYFIIFFVRRLRLCFFSHLFCSVKML